MSDHTTVNPTFEKSFSTRTLDEIKGGILAKAKEIVATDKIQLGLSWEFYAGLPKIDLDVSCVCFNSTGTLVDAAFFNNMSCLDGSITHSGDIKSGEKEGFDEVITIDMANISSVHVMVFVLSAYSGGDLKGCESTMCEVKDISTNSILCQSTMPGKSDKHGFIIGSLFRHPDNGNWNYSAISEAITGRHFMASMPAIRQVVDSVLDPGAIQERKLTGEKTFKMTKGDVLVIEENIRQIRIGLGWETLSGGIDLDASCIMLNDVDGDGKLDPVDICYFGNKIRQGVQSLGDNMSGAGSGDDETIVVDLTTVDKNVSGLAFAVNVYSSNRSFSDVKSAYIRLFDGVSNHEYCRYTFQETDPKVIAKTGLIFCMMTRKAPGSQEWNLSMIGETCGGRRVAEIETPLWDGLATACYTPAAPTVSSPPSEGCCTIA